MRGPKDCPPPSPSPSLYPYPYPHPHPYAYAYPYPGALPQGLPRQRPLLRRPVPVLPGLRRERVRGDARMRGELQLPRRVQARPVLLP